MYDELVKRLRQLAEEQMFDFERKPYLQAADAIETLSKRVEELEYDPTCDPEWRNSPDRREERYGTEKE